MNLKRRLEQRCGNDLDLVGAVLAISRIPYGRPSMLTSAGVVDEWRGTCSTKHVLLSDLARESWPATDPRLWHRPYMVTPHLARERWGDRIARAVPEDGLVDVHTYATLRIDGRRTRVDVTFALTAWDGRSDIPLACGDGKDHPAGDDPNVSKAELVRTHCDPFVREPFIAALAAVGSA